ncbi:cytochrome P450 [Amycolatopsis suaedae]|uniref:Cytochrome P450 n=1 Tax=Amycolatopsis suaedae TaxID=2510978 RepID=A0A4V2ELA9_9PSEU|nr:cytochrome P450 [Amycolatopsis suaedae]RZQ60925.1 cytochrome P450 [Amycolatopsis suaedae]
MTGTREVVDFPIPRECPYHPPAVYAEARAEGPLFRVRLYDGRVAWLVTRYADVRALFADADRFSSNRDNPDFPIPAERERHFREFFRTLAGLDGEAHKTRRSMLVGRFTVRQVDRLRPYIQRTTDLLIDRMLDAGPPADLISALGRPLPSMVISELLGVPYADHERFEKWSQGLMHAPTAEEAWESGQQLVAYMDALIKEKEAEPTDDLLGTLITERMHTGELTREELVRLALAVLAAGHETTASMIGLGTLTLLEHPDQLDVLKADPGAALRVVDELSRFLSVADLTTLRVVTEDVEVGGQLVRAGEGVILSTAAANRDPDVYPEPDRLDVSRQARNNLAFGFGPHRCVGENLARAELEIVFGTLFRRVPKLRLAMPLDEIPRKVGMTLEGMLELPVTWT